MSSNRIFAVAVAWTAAMALAPAAFAEEPAPIWRAPSACPGPDTFRDAVRLELGRDLSAAEARRIRARVTRRGEVWELSLETGEGRREVKARDCAELVRTGAFFVALALEAASASDRPAPEPEIERTEISPSRTSQAMDPELPKHPTVRRAASPGLPPAPTSGRPGLAVGAVLATDVGTLPNPAVGLGASLARVTGPWRFEGTVHYLFEEKTRLPEMQGVGGDFSAALLSLRGCRQLFADLGAGVCAGFDVGAMRGESFGLAETATDIVPLSALALGFEGHWWLAGPLYLSADAEILGRVVSEGFRAHVATYPGPEPELRSLHETETVSVRTFTGLELRFR